jgi:hypothetical protein
VASRPFYCLLSFAVGAEPIAIGVLLYWPETNELFLQFRESFQDIASPDDQEVLALLSDDLAAKAAELEPLVLVAYLEDTFSNTILISSRFELDSNAQAEPSAVLEILFSTLVKQ